MIACKTTVQHTPTKNLKKHQLFNSNFIDSHSAFSSSVWRGLSVAQGSWKREKSLIVMSRNLLVFFGVSFETACLKSQYYYLLCENYFIFSYFENSSFQFESCLFVLIIVITLLFLDQFKKVHQTQINWVFKILLIEVTNLC